MVLGWLAPVSDYELDRWSGVVSVTCLEGAWEGVLVV